MKRIFALILCFTMLLTTIVVSAAQGETGDREINVYVDKTNLFANQTVTVTVKIEGTNTELANAQYDLVYDPALFECDKDTDGDGRISEMKYKTAGAYTDGEELGTYTFKALPQIEEKSGEFSIENAISSTWIESAEGIKGSPTSKAATVTIKLITYDIKVLFDSEEQSSNKKELNYDDKTHTFEVTAEPSETVEGMEDAVKEITYKVNGESKTLEEINQLLKAQDTYEITYEVVPNDGYKKESGSFTVIIKEPEYVVEVPERQYVFGKKIVLVYTSTDNTYFNYDGHEMIDVSNRGYLYNGTESYSRVFAFVTDSLNTETYTAPVSDYKDNITNWYTGDTTYKVYAVGNYTTDINYDGVATDMLDITTAYGVNNAYSYYFETADKEAEQIAEYQKKILRTDTDGNKYVDGTDTGAVVSAVANN